MQMAQPGTNTARAWVVLFFFFLFPQSHEEPGRGREVRTHTYPSMPACALLSNLTCLLLLSSWKNVKLSSVIKVGFSKGFKNISEFKTLFLLQKMKPSSIPLTDASWGLLSRLVFLSGFPWWGRAGMASAVVSFAASSSPSGMLPPDQDAGEHVQRPTAPPECV